MTNMNVLLDGSNTVNCKQNPCGHNDLHVTSMPCNTSSAGMQWAEKPHTALRAGLLTLQGCEHSASVSAPLEASAGNASPPAVVRTACMRRVRPTTRNSLTYNPMDFGNAHPLPVSKGHTFGSLQSSGFRSMQTANGINFGTSP